MSERLMTKFNVEEQINSRGLTEVEELQNRHREIARLSIHGKTNKEIAKIVGCSQSTVCNVLKNPLVKGHTRELNKSRDAYLVEAQEQLTSLLPEITEFYDGVISGELPVRVELRASLAKDVLDRVGLPKMSKSVIESTSLSGKITGADIERIRERRRAENVSVEDIDNEQQS